MRIGILEDNESMCRVLQLNLEHAGHTVKVNQTVEEFLAALDHDIIIVDFRLRTEEEKSRMSGADVIRYVRSVAPDMPAILISAAPMTTLRAVSRGLTKVQTLQKPFEMSYLIETIRALA